MSLLNSLKFLRGGTVNLLVLWIILSAVLNCSVGQKFQGKFLWLFKSQQNFPLKIYTTKFTLIFVNSVSS